MRATVTTDCITKVREAPPGTVACRRGCHPNRVSHGSSGYLRDQMQPSSSQGQTLCQTRDRSPGADHRASWWAMRVLPPGDSELSDQLGDNREGPAETVMDGCESRGAPEPGLRRLRTVFEIAS